MKKFFKKFDLVIVVCVLFLVIVGIVMVGSASSYVAMQNYGDKYYYVKKQIIACLIGFAFFILMLFINIQKLKKYRLLFLGVSLALLAVLFIPGVGKSSYGANRWINFGAFTFQPSEVAKFGFVFYSASVMATSSKDPKTFKAMLPTLFAGVSMCVLIMLEPNMSITMCVGIVMVIMLFVGGSSYKHMLAIGIPALLTIPLLIIAEPYRLKRLTAFLDPWASPLDEGFQLIQSYYALGSGGWFGVGIGNSRQKYLFLPFAESDFIFSVIGEELGFAFCLLLILVYVILIVRGFKLSLKADTRFKCYLGIGITSLIAVQTLINIAVVTGSIPPTGLPLPFISAGGTSIIVFMGAVGILCNISKRSKPNEVFEDKKINSFNLNLRGKFKANLKKK